MTTNRTTATVKSPPAAEMVDDLSIDYPETDFMPMPDNDEQFIPVTDALSALRYFLSSRDDAYVSGNLLVYYRMNDNRTRLAPDVFVVMGGTRKGMRDSWLTWREGKVPDFVMEVASRSTWRYDARGKRAIYAAMGVSEYWRFDPVGRYFNPPLVAERLVDGEYRPKEVTADADGIWRGYSPTLGLDICALPGPLLRFYDPQNAVWLRTYDEYVAAWEAAERDRQVAESALQQEAAARQAAESALQQESAARQALEDEIRRLRQQLPPGE